MKYAIFIGGLLSIICSPALFTISIVYNFRIAQITKQSFFHEKHKKKYSVILLPFDQYQKKYVGDITQNFLGELSTFIYNFDNNYFRIDAAFSHIHETTLGATTFTSTETDDILFTIGRDFHLNEQSKVTLSGLFSVPTHKILSLKHISFGYGQVGTGLQLDGLYEFKPRQDIIYGARYVHFYPGSAQDSSCTNYRFGVGNLADLLLAYKYNWPHHHGIEFGATQRWDFGASICPALDNTVAKTEYTRSNFYFVYKYRFKRPSANHRLLLNIAYGFDEKPKLYGNKLILTLWAAWDVRFN